MANTLFTVIGVTLGVISAAMLTLTAIMIMVTFITFLLQELLGYPNKK